MHPLWVYWRSITPFKGIITTPQLEMHVTHNMAKATQYADRDDYMYYTATPMGSFVGTENGALPHIGKIHPDDKETEGFGKLLPRLVEEFGWKMAMTGVMFDVATGSAVKYVLLNPQHFVATDRTPPPFGEVKAFVNEIDGMRELNWFFVLTDDDGNEYQYHNFGTQMMFVPKAPPRSMFG